MVRNSMKMWSKREISLICLGVMLGVFCLVAPNAFADEAQSGNKNSSTAITTQSNASAVAKVSGKWEKWKSGWYFKKTDGVYATGFIQPNSDKRIYYLNNKGLMKTGWVKVNGKWYWAASNGALHSGWKKLKGKWYYLDPKVANHPAVTGFFSDGKARYYCDPTSCAMKTGWIKSGDKWYWAKSNGALVSGWKKLDAWYYLDPTQENYPALTGKYTVGGVEYFSKSDCRLVQNGWANISASEERYAGPSGALLDFYADRSDGGLRIRNSAGEMLTGWQKLGNDWFYLKPEDGKAVSGKYTVDGKVYYFGENYVWLKGGDMKTLLKSVDKVSKGWYVSVKGTSSIPDWLIKRLNNDMLALWNSGADVGFVLVDVNSGVTIAGNASKWFYSASTLKGPYVCALAQHWPSKAKNWKGTIKSTISVSSNEGYASLRQAFGSGVMKTYMKEATVSSISPSSYYQNIRPRDLAKLWVRNYEYFKSGNSTRKWVQPYFVHTSHSFIDAELGKKYWVYSKPGWFWGSPQVYNDAGIVMKGDTPYVLAILSSGASGTHDGKLRKLVRDLNTAQGYIYS